MPMRETNDTNNNATFRLNKPNVNCNCRYGICTAKKIGDSCLPRVCRNYLPLFCISLPRSTTIYNRNSCQLVVFSYLLRLVSTSSLFNVLWLCQKDKSAHTVCVIDFSTQLTKNVGQILLEVTTLCNVPLN